MAEIDQRCAGANVEVDVAMRRDEAAHTRQQPARSERRHDADPEVTRVPVLGHFAHGLGEFRERDLDAAREPLAFVGQPDAAPGALDQRHAECVLEPLELMADRAVRDAQRIGGTGQAAAARDGLKRAQGLQGRDPQCHRRSIEL